MSAGGTRTFDIRTSDGHLIRADLYPPTEGHIKGVVVMCHGFKGHRKWGFFPELASRLSRSGLAAIPFDFSHNGWIVENTEKSKDLPSHPIGDVFRKNTVTREFEDLTSMVQYISENRLNATFPDDLPIGVYGHSRGGFVAILYALERKGVDAICTWAAIANPNHFTERQKQRWRQEGHHAFVDSKTGYSLAIDTRYLDDLEANAERYRLTGRIHRLRVPHLLVHGSMDLAVPADSSKALLHAERELENKRLLILKTGHTFGMANTFFKPSSAFEVASEATVRWFEDHLELGA
ncbi:MAG: alpha/beta fold hydrolase [Candidatus Latescibacteria bacterium]|nr:alpha/beta fold hydrolase [Candidatus Latescibacterota bacterium]NIM66461.1 alpha/beta fold hydrolase [Candidatus Latescibacterota bacterium]NIO02941.1 alpha/beta fold hydrolase [Candidatus Latescibacterota bacterium]NIO30076.1 alpha/beta fold hydrolase [Candidatus Latescibacterota bacterium]NIO57691.1 alpha/beta fold hydrolase [Candidatus Latescibacterota bacterium]